MSNDLFNTYSEDCIAVPLTSVLKERPHSFIITQNDLALGTLFRKSRITVNKIFTIKQTLIRAKIGRLNDNAFQLAKLELYKIIE